MYFQLQKNKEFNSTINKLYKKYSNEIIDILVFGSSIKGKDKPKDLDLLIIFHKKEDLDIAYEFKIKLQKFNPEIITKTWKNMNSSTFQAREAILGESYSLISKGFFSETLGYKAVYIFQYELKNLTSTERVRFHYALFGRDKISGIFKQLSLNKLSDSTILCPTENSEKLKEFLKYWQLKYKSYPILIPLRKIN